MLTLVFATMVTFAQVEFYQEGNRLYQEGDYEGALASYLRLIEAGFEAGEVYYNIGNSYFKLGEVAHSILYFERAKRLLPRDEDVLVNLDLARSLTVDEIQPLPRFWLFGLFDWWVGFLPKTFLVAAVTLAYLIGMGSTIILILRRDLPSVLWGGRMSLLCGGFLLVFGLNLVVRESGIAQAEEGIVIESRVEVRSAPLDDQTLMLFTVHEGTKVRVDRRSEEWAEVVLEDGKVGWIPVEVFETI